MIAKILRSLPDFKGKRRLVKFLFRNKVQSGNNIPVNGKFGIHYLLPNLRESISLDIFTNGIYEEDTHAFLISQIKEKGVFLDLGANIGSISIPLIKRRPDIKCFCVEAAPWIFDFLQKNISLNLPDGSITCINRALMDKDAQSVPFYSPSEQFGKGSLAPVFTQEAVMVNSLTIDNLVTQQGLLNVDFIKMDIEGFEYFAFKGAEILLKKEDAPVILFEFVDWAEENAGITKGQAQQLLLDYGYRLFVLTGEDKWRNLPKPLTNGSEMIFATKRSFNF